MIGQRDHNNSCAVASRPIRALRCSLAAVVAWSLASCAGGGKAPRDGAERAVPGQALGLHSATDGDGGAVPAKSPAAVKETTGLGRISVRVNWLEAPAELRRSPGRDRCGDPLPAPLSIHTLGGVRNAVVWLDGLDARAATARPASGGRAPGVAVEGCRLRPRVTVSTSGPERVLVVRNGGEERQRVSMRPVGKKGEAIAFAMPLVGSRVSLPMAEPGLWQIAIAREPRVVSYVVVSGHSHVAMTDDKGVARLDSVPPGRHQLVVWHPPVRPGQPAIELRRDIEVDSEKAKEIAISLALK